MMLESLAPRVEHSPVGYPSRFLRSFSSTSSIDQRRKLELHGPHVRRGSATTKPPSPCTVRVEGAKFATELEWSAASETSGATDGADADICVALAGIEYNSATQRLTGSVKVRNLAETPVRVVVRYRIDEDEKVTETDAQLLFGSAGTYMDLDVYAFSLRTGRNVLTQPGQVLALSVCVYVDGVVAASDDNNGQWYRCRAEARSPFMC